MNTTGEAMKERGRSRLMRCIAAASVMVILCAGCTTVQKDVAHFEPIPREEIGSVELEPIEPEGGGRLRLGHSHSDSYSNLDIPFPLPQPILDEIDELQNSYPRTFERGLNRSTRYLPHLRAEFRNAGLPEDLAMLAMVESMFQPKVVSPAGAGGMWQFMRATGRRYNLRMDSYVDERYNWHSATQAAISYLQYLHDFFDGDWALAVTAYNMGEGGLDRAIKSVNQECDFFTLLDTPPASTRIKQESKKFYPRLIAYIIVSKNPEEYGFELNGEPFEDVIRVPVKGMYQLAHLDKALQLPAGTLAKLNPDLLREATPPQGEYPVAIPREKRAQLATALQTVKSVRHAGTHRVKRGETVSQIARHYGVCERELMRMNNIRSPRALQVNQTLQLPGTALERGGAVEEVSPSAPVPTQVATARTESAPASSSRSGSAAAAPAMRTYKVKKGDTLSGIASTNKVKVADLQKWNNLNSRSHIQVGQTLRVGPGTAQAAAPSGPVRQHTVKPGEYPGVIAELYGVSVSDLLRWNNLNGNSVIRPGDTLVVAGDAAPASSGSVQTAASQDEKPAPPATLRHKVARGETAGGIASHYGVATADLLAWNNLTAKSILRVGQELTIRNPAHSVAQRDRGGDVQMAQSQSNNRVVHKVTAGQNPTTIARQYGVSVNDLFKWNKWKEKHVLRVGDEVEIFRD